ncbi:MAG TPA: hypothetical protein VK939_03705 [Longimicrobiales bacterium]|nr:hypothetical protein [Longimicrobiales bacterium]
MRISGVRAGSFEAVARVPDAGPIADKELAVVLPTHGQRELRVRLDFLADSWRIDQVALSLEVSRPMERLVPVAVVSTTSGVADTAARSRLGEPDERYLITLPGEALRIGFEVGGGQEEGTSYSYLLASQGYYTEWVRRDWVRASANTQAFTPGDAALDAAYARWRTVRSDFETQFYARRVPVGRS